MQTRTAHKSKIRPIRRTRAMLRARRKSPPHKPGVPARLPEEQQFDHALGIDIEFKKVFGSGNQTDIAEYFDRFI